MCIICIYTSQTHTYSKIYYMYSTCTLTYLYIVHICTHNTYIYDIPHMHTTYHYMTYKKDSIHQNMHTHICNEIMVTSMLCGSAVGGSTNFRGTNMPRERKEAVNVLLLDGILGSCRHLAIFGSFGAKFKGEIDVRLLDEGAMRHIFDDLVIWGWVKTLVPSEPQNSW